MDDKITMPDSYWKERLTPEQYRVCRMKGTEPPFSGALYHNDATGVYECVACGQPLFSSDTKFDSGSGWPSFDRASSAGTVTERSDRGLGMTRTEILCARCGGHLGHVFPDGPTDTGLRYCVNSLSLTYEPDAGESAAAD